MYLPAVFPKRHPSLAGVEQEFVIPCCLPFAPRAPDALSCSFVLPKMITIVVNLRRRWAPNVASIVNSTSAERILDTIA